MAGEIKILCGKKLHDMVARTKITELFQKIASLEENGTGGGIAKETDPTVPAWAKQPQKPTYTADEVGAASKEAFDKLSEEKVNLPKDADGKLIAPTDGQTLLFRADGTTYYGTPSSSGGDTGTTVHGIVWDLENVTSSNNIVSIAEGSSLVAALTPSDGYTLGDVTVTMGGEALTGVWNADTSTVAIASVTGDVIISCSGVKQTTDTTTETLGAVSAYSGNVWPKVVLNDDETYTATLSDTFLDPTTHIGTYSLYMFGQEVAGGTLNIEWDTNVMTGLKFLLWLSKTPVTPNFDGTPITVEGAAVLKTNPASGYGKYISGDVEITELGTSACTFWINGEVNFKIPDGYYPILAFYRESSMVNEEQLTNSNAAVAEWTYNNVKVTMSKTITGGDSGGSGEDDTMTTSVLSVDEDYAQDYGVSTLSLVTDEATKEIELDVSYASVIEEAKNAWLTEANGNINKIPLLIHTDQHGATNKPLFDFINKIIDWYDIGKVINLGDTVDGWGDATNLLTCEGLEEYVASMESIPYSKRIEIYGNHDVWGGLDGVTVGMTPNNHLYKYFRNIYARRADNHGNFVVIDDNYNVKYLAVSGFAFDSDKGGYSHYIIPSDSIDWIIAELEKEDGYDVIVLSHVPLGANETPKNPITGEDSDSTPNYASAVNFKLLVELWSGRKAKTSGSVTDEYGIVHEFDFTGCNSEILCGLHGHMHDDGYYYIGELLDVYFDAYYISPKAIHFVLVDRENRQLNVWKVEDTPAYTNYQIPFDKPTETE